MIGIPRIGPKHPPPKAATLEERLARGEALTHEERQQRAWECLEGMLESVAVDDAVRVQVAKLILTAPAPREETPGPKPWDEEP